MPPCVRLLGHVGRAEVSHQQQAQFASPVSEGQIEADCPDSIKMLTALSDT